MLIWHWRANYSRDGLQMRKRIPCRRWWNNIYQGSLLTICRWYTSGCQVLVCLDFDEIIDNPEHHCDFVLFSSWLKVLLTKFLQDWSDTAGSAIVIVAKLGSTLLYRLHFGYVGFCYRVPYRRSIFKLWTNYGLVAFGLDIIWTARKISTEEGCSLMGLFPSLYRYGCSRTEYCL